MGLCVLGHFPAIMADREAQWKRYSAAFAKVPGLAILPVQKGLGFNHSYFPLLLKDYDSMELVRNGLLQEDIIARRYFYPSLDELPYLATTQPCPISRSVASRVICLPMFHGLTSIDQDRVIDVVMHKLSKES